MPRAPRGRGRSSTTWAPARGHSCAGSTTPRSHRSSTRRASPQASPPPSSRSTRTCWRAPCDRRWPSRPTSRSCPRTQRAPSPKRRTASRVEGDGPQGRGAFMHGQVVNATWERRVALDLQLGIPPPPQLLHRLKFRIIGRLPAGAARRAVRLDGARPLRRRRDPPRRNRLSVLVSGRAARLEPRRSSRRRTGMRACRGEVSPSHAREIASEIRAGFEDWCPAMARPRAAPRRCRRDRRPRAQRRRRRRQRAARSVSHRRNLARALSLRRSGQAHHRAAVRGRGRRPGRGAPPRGERS